MTRETPETTDAARLERLVAELADCFGTVCGDGWRIHPWAVTLAATRTASQLLARYAQQEPGGREAALALAHDLVRVVELEAPPATSATKH